jgi:hypothetical protein
MQAWEEKHANRRNGKGLKGEEGNYLSLILPDADSETRI